MLLSINPAMLADYQRAAIMKNSEGVSWLQFVQSRFTGRFGREDAVLTIDVQALTQRSDCHAELRGVVEHSANTALPVATEFIATLEFANREVRINTGRASAFFGQLSENGRVLTLFSDDKGFSPTKPLHLIHEGTSEELFGI
jgi:hypothetical protein